MKKFLVFFLLLTVAASAILSCASGLMNRAHSETAPIEAELK